MSKMSNTSLELVDQIITIEAQSSETNVNITTLETEPSERLSPIIRLSTHDTRQPNRTDRVRLKSNSVDIDRLTPYLSGNSTKMDLTGGTNPTPLLASSTILSSSQTNLVRKYSCGDLVSRLKSRKLLGVGESCEQRGEIYRSKISQLLGHSEHLFARYPCAFWYWYAFLLLTNVSCALWNLLGHLTNNPEQEINDYNPEMVPIVTFFRQSLGIWHLVFASILWRFYRSNDKSLIRFLLFVCIAFSLAKITLILYYDHCTLIRLKTWLTTLICSKCSNDSSNNGSTTDYGSCTRFGSNSIQYLPPSEIATYLSIESIELLINVLYHHKMSISNVNNASNSILTSGTISSGRITTKRTCSFEYVSFLFNSYLINPFVRLFHCSATTNESETTNSSIPNAKTEETEKMSVPHGNKSNE